MKLKGLTMIFLLVTIFSFAVIAQTSPASGGKPQTVSKGKVYQNNLYNFNFETPAGWTEIASEASKPLAEAGKEMLKPNRKGQAELEKSLQLTQTLLHLAKYPIGTPRNASLICAVEINQTPEATIEQTALASQQAFANNFGYTITVPAKQIMLGGRNFFLFKVKKDFETGVTLYQSIYLRKIGNKVLQFVLSYTNPEDGEVMEKSLQTLKFTK